MSWLGRILVFLVLIASLAWAYFTVNVYVTRNNWKAEAERYKKAYQEISAAREADWNFLQKEKDTALRLYTAEKSRADDLSKNMDELATTGRKDDTNFAKLLKDYEKADVQNQQLTANLKITLDERDNTRTRNTFLEGERVKLVLEKETAVRDRIKAENEKKLADALAADNARKIESLLVQINELKATGGSGTAAVLRSLDKPPAPLPDNIRGTVLYDMKAGNLVLISIGIDAGLEPGSKLDIYRENGGGQYLGTLTVTTTLKPKEAVAEFKPARGVPISQLRPDEIPRKGDIVGKLR